MSWAGPEDIYLSTSLASYLDRKLLVLLRDGRKLMGILRSFDQFANAVLEGACERVIVGDLYCDIPLGLYVIRGENVVLIGELDLEREELPPHMTRVSVAEIRRVFTMMLSINSDVFNFLLWSEKKKNGKERRIWEWMSEERNWEWTSKGRNWEWMRKESTDLSAIKKQIEDLKKTVLQANEETNPPKWWEAQDKRISSLESRMTTTQSYMEQILGILTGRTKEQVQNSPGIEQMLHMAIEDTNDRYQVFDKLPKPKVDVPVQQSYLWYSSSSGDSDSQVTRLYKDREQPVAGNYYPINLGIYMVDKKFELSVLVDRATGGSSIKDGEMELMFHGRMIVDDSKGVGEVLTKVSLREPQARLLLMGINLKDALIEVKKIIGKGSGFVAVEIPFTFPAKCILEISWEEARQLGHNILILGHTMVMNTLQGEWVSVVDDWIPCESPGELAFATNKKANELWVSILEKVYAKLHGSYEALEGGLVQDALVDLTGGAGEEIDMRSSEAQLDLASGRLWSQLLRFKQEGFLLGDGSPSSSDVKVFSSGIVQGHAYSLLQVREVDGYKLIQIRNPWANEVEWNGPWSDSSSEWTDRMRHKLKHVPQSNGDYNLWQQNSQLRLRETSPDASYPIHVFITLTQGVSILEFLNEKISKLLSGDDTKAVQKIVISIGHMCVKETSASNMKIALDLIFSLCRSKVEDILIAAGEALSFLWGGVPVTSDVILKTNFSSLSMSSNFLLGDTSMKKNLVDALVTTLTGSGKRKRAIKLVTWRYFKRSLLVKALVEGNLALTRSFRGVAFEFSEIAKQAGDALQPHLRVLIPRLVRYQYDPDKNVQDAMAHLWKALVVDPKRAIDKNLEIIFDDLLIQCGSRLWCSREELGLALADIIQSRKFDQVGKYLKKIWVVAFRAMDDIKETYQERTMGVVSFNYKKEKPWAVYGSLHSQTQGKHESKVKGMGCEGTKQMEIYRNLKVGGRVYLKFQSYHQTSLALRKGLKLAARFYGSIGIDKRREREHNQIPWMKLELEKVTVKKKRQGEEDLGMDERGEKLGMDAQGLGIGKCKLGIEAREGHMINLPDELEQAEWIQEELEQSESEGQYLQKKGRDKHRKQKARQQISKVSTSFMEEVGVVDVLCRLEDPPSPSQHPVIVTFVNNASDKA
ncbi:hypothetical protein F3Y22_tig00117032pilonHSYRG00254 [Hibiscus syriacus]|uniref:Uncharacterized protein n=1 Tax=Hibiscus syriacus TaxID=106335 RepID=A0A6A2WNE4_HIBSY|nr:hypothetical protein F3Y22_tig00117032pilonHSYRG00254 [Hibiscus syriacus]